MTWLGVIAIYLAYKDDATSAVAVGMTIGTIAQDMIERM